MDFMFENSGVVKLLLEDGPVSIDELVPAEMVGALDQFVGYLEVLKALSCEPKTGVERFHAGLNPYETLDTMTPQDHENLLFIIDYFDLPAELATRVRFNLTRNIEKCFPDVLKINTAHVTDAERNVCFWIAVDEIKGVNAGLSNKRIWNLIGILNFCGETANKKYFDHILSTFDAKEKIRWTNSLLLNSCRQIVEWMCESETFPGTKTFNDVIQERITYDDDVNNDDDRHSNNVACLDILMVANKKWKQPFDCKQAFNRALVNQNTEMLELLYSFGSIDPAEDDYMKTAAKKHTFVWLCNKKSPTLLTTPINIQTLKMCVIKGFVCENVKWFHENIEPITDADIVAQFPVVIEDYDELAIWLQFINTTKMADTLEYYRSQGLNVMLPQFCIIAIIGDDTKAIRLLHKWGFEFTKYHLDYAAKPQPDGYGHYSLNAFYLIHKYLRFCKLSKEIVNMFTWECSSDPVIYKNKIKYLKRCRRIRLLAKRLATRAGSP